MICHKTKPKPKPNHVYAKPLIGNQFRRRKILNPNSLNDGKELTLYARVEGLGKFKFTFLCSFLSGYFFFVHVPIEYDWHAKRSIRPTDGTRAVPTIPVQGGVESNENDVQIPQIYRTVASQADSTLYHTLGETFVGRSYPSTVNTVSVFSAF